MQLPASYESWRTLWIRDISRWLPDRLESRRKTFWRCCGAGGFQPSSSWYITSSSQFVISLLVSQDVSPPSMQAGLALSSFGCGNRSSCFSRAIIVVRPHRYIKLPKTMLTKTGLLLWRLYHYRREFGRMISARDTTKSRFVRLVIMSLILAVFMLPYAMWIFYKEVKSIKGPFVWETVHGPNWNSIIKVPSHGIVWWDNWGRLVVGYLVFFIFGTGNDAKALYQGWLVKMGLGKVFPSLYERPGDSQTSSHGSGTWNTFKGKTKSFFTAASWTSSHRSPPTTVTESSRDDAM